MISLHKTLIKPVHTEKAYHAISCMNPMRKSVSLLITIYEKWMIRIFSKNFFSDFLLWEIKVSLNELWSGFGWAAMHCSSKLSFFWKKNYHTIFIYKTCIICFFPKKLHNFSIPPILLFVLFLWVCITLVTLGQSGKIFQWSSWLFFFSMF